MTSSDSVAQNAVNAYAFFAAYAGKAKAAIREIKHAAEGELRVLSGCADDMAHNARKAGDDKAANDIIRCQGILEDELANYARISLRRVDG